MSSVAERSQLAEVVPEQWRNEYQDVVLTKGKDGHDYLYGVDAEGRKNPRLSWEPLDQSIKEFYGIERAEPYPALRSENEELRLQNSLLKQDVQSLRDEMSAMESRFNAKIAQLEEKLAQGQGPADIADFQKVRQWTPRPGQTITAPVEPGQPANILTIESIDTADKSAVVQNSEGKKVGMPLTQLARYWNDQQIRAQRDRLAKPKTLRGRMDRAYGAILRRRTDTVPTVIINQEGRPAIILEDEEFEDKRPLAVAALAAGLLLGGLVGYGLSNKDEGPTVQGPTITRTVTRPLPANSIVIGKQRYNVLLHDEKALAAVQAKNSKLKEEVHDLQGAQASQGGPASPTPNRKNASLSYRGDTVWNEVSKKIRERLGYQANANTIKKATTYVLRLNGLRWNSGGYGVDAHKLPVGFRFKIPDNIVKIIS